MTKVLLLLCALLMFRPGYAQPYEFRDTARTAEERADDIVKRMTLEEKIDLLSGYNDFYLHPCERLGIPAFKLADGPLGVASWGLFGRATAFPSALSLAASWNRELASAAGAMYAQEWRARGIHFLLAPGVNVYRASKGARNFEYYGEDPYLSSEMVVPFIRGVQDGGVIATVKHFAANDQEFDRYTVSSELSERTLREICLPPFEAAVRRAGVKAVMTGYNPVNGVYNTQNRHLIDILKKEWGFRGMLMSDWACTYSAEEAANNGLDLEMGSNICFIREKLLPLVRSGRVSEAVIDDKVRRVYRACIEMGFFDRPQRVDSVPLFNPEANRMALAGAREGILLLRNEGGFLPLDRRTVKTIAVIGPTANPDVISDRMHTNNGIVYGGGGSSKVNPWYVVSDLEGIRRVFNDAAVLYAEGISNRFRSVVFRSSRFTTETGENGMKASYYRDTVISGQPFRVRTDRQVNFEWWRSPDGWKELGDDYAVRWEGFVTAEKSDDLIFFVDAQGGYRLWVDDRLMLDAAKSQSFDVRNCRIPVTAGDRKKVVLEFYSHRSHPAEIRMGYAYDQDIDFSEALKIARKADVVVFCGGLDGAVELEGRDRPFDLPYGQDILIDSLLKVNPRMVVVMHAGGGVNMTRWADRVPAVVHALYPGQEGGRALAEILAGEVNPSARLPFTIEKRWEDSPACGNYDETRREKKVYYNEGVFCGYRGYDKKDIAPLFPFGYGLSYTTFAYSDLKIGKVAGKSLRVKISFCLKNTGDRAGSEVAQVYVRDVKSAEERPLKELKGFEKVMLNPGEERKVEIELDETAFRYFNSRKNTWVMERGEFEIMVGSSSRNIKLTEPIKL